MQFNLTHQTNRIYICLLMLCITVACEDSQTEDSTQNMNEIEDSMIAPTTNDQGLINPSDASIHMDSLVDQFSDGLPDLEMSTLDSYVDADMTLDMSMQMVNFAPCETALGGDPWENMVTESQVGFEEDLMNISLDRLPEEIDISEMIPLFKGIVAYMLDKNIMELDQALQKRELLAQGMLGRVVAASLLLGQMDPLGIDFLFLRRGLHRYYHCDRGFPLTLEGFKQSIFNYSEQTQITDSIAKCGTRNIFTDEAQGVYVAETLADGVVRETEIILSGRRRDGNLDFLVYNADGQLSDRTRFPTIGAGSEVMAASPYVCTSCHINSDEETDYVWYDLLFPQVGPCE